MQVRSHSSLESSINVTPLVDVCLVLLIIFMVIVPSMLNAVPVKLPTTAHGVADAPHPLEITIKNDGSLYLGTLVVRREQAASELAKLHEKSPERAVGVRGDKDVPYGDVVEVLDACRAAGYEDVKLMTERRETTRDRDPIR